MLETWEIVILVVAALIAVYIVMDSPLIGFDAVRGFNMDIYTKRPQYTQMQRGRFDPDLVVTETFNYPRSGQPFSYTQQVIQDARYPTNSQFEKQQELFALSGWPQDFPELKTAAARGGADRTAAVYNQQDAAMGNTPAAYFAEKSEGRGRVRGAGAGQVTPAWQGVNTAQIRAGGTSDTGARHFDGQGPGKQTPQRENIRGFATMNVDAYDDPLTNPNLAGGWPYVDPSFYNNQFVQDFSPVDGKWAEGMHNPQDQRMGPGTIVWTQTAGPPAINDGTRDASFATMSTEAKWLGTATPADPNSRAAKSVSWADGYGASAAGGASTAGGVVPSGGILEPYGDRNVYAAPGSVPIARDGQPIDWRRKYLGADGKVMTGLAHRPAEIDPRLDMLPPNHPQKLANQHWHAAAIKGNLPPTEARKFRERFAGDVKRFRQLPWSFGNA